MAEITFPAVEDLGAVVIELRVRVEALEAAQPNYPAKPDSSPASVSSLVDRLASVGVSRFYVKAAIREVAAWLRDSEGDYSTIRQLEMQADTNTSQED